MIRKSLIFKLGFPLFLLLLNAQFAHSQEKEEEENSLKELIQEFPFTETVYLQDQNEIQQILFYSHAKNENIGNSLGYKIEYGLTDWFQLTAGYAYNHWKTDDYSYDDGWLKSGLKMSLFNNSKNAGAIAVEAEFPINKPNIETEEEFNPSYTPMLIYARDFNQIQIHANAGAEITKDQTEWVYNLAAVYGDGNVHPLLELNARDEEEFNWFAGTGVVLNNENGWELVAGARHGIDNSHWNAILDIIYEFTPGKTEN